MEHISARKQCNHTIFAMTEFCAKCPKFLSRLKHRAQKKMLKNIRDMKNCSHAWKTKIEKKKDEQTKEEQTYRKVDGGDTGE